MKAFEIKRLLAATVMAVLPIACGTESPTGIDAGTFIAEQPAAAKRRPVIAATPAPAPRPTRTPEAAPAPVIAPAVEPAVAPAIEPEADPSADGARACRAAATEVLILRGSEPLPLHGVSVLLQLAMIDKDGVAVEDGSCLGVQWSVDGTKATDGALPTSPLISVSADTRFATVSGPPGNYVMRAITPNGRIATVPIRL